MATALVFSGLICYLVLWSVVIESIAMKSYSKRRETIIFVLAGLFLLFMLPGLVML